MQQLWEFGGRAIIIIVLCSALMGGTTGYALASYGRFSRVLGVVIGSLLSCVGVAGLLIAALVRRSAPVVSQRSAPAPATAWGDSSTALASAGETGFGFAEDDLYSSTWGTGAGAPAEPSLVASSRWAWTRSKPGLISTATAVVSAVVLASTLVAAWLSINAAIVPRFWVFPIGTGLDIAVVVSLVVCGICIVAIAAKPYRWGAILLALVANGWLFFALMVVSARESTAQVLAEVGALSFTVGDTLSAFGVDTSAGRIELPPEVDLSAVGIPGRTIDMGAVELGRVIPDVAIDLGPGIVMLVIFATIANVAVMLVLHAAHSAETKRLTS